MTRRRFLSAACACGAALALPTSRSEPAAAFSVAEIAPGVFVHQGEHALMNAANLGGICNSAFVVGRDAVAVIDPGGSARIGQALRRAIRAQTPLPVRYVVDTHMHPDHVFGNVAFEADEPAFVAHRKMARGLAARAQRYLELNREAMGEAAFAGTRIVMPTVEVDTDTPLELDLGGRVLHLQARQTAHTDNDLTVRDSATGTFFLGDLLFVGHVPTIDGSIKGWLALIDTLAAEPAARAVPGHGPASVPWPEAIAPERRYLEAIARDVRRIVKRGGTIEEAVRTAARSEAGAWELFPQYHVRNVTAAFAELEWE